MKKLLIFMIILFTTVLSSCATTEVETDPFDEEYKRIESLIPLEFSSDISLPSPSTDFTINYYLNDIKIDNTLIYTPYKEDTLVRLGIIINKDTSSRTYEITLTQIGNEEEYLKNEQNKLFDASFETIFNQIPDVFTSHVTLPQIENIITSYNIDCSSIFRNRVIYTFPSTSETCLLSISMTINGIISNRSKQVTMSSIDDLPKLPEIHINTNNQAIESKDSYIDASLSTVMNGNTEYDAKNNEGIQIRLRGNSTLHMPKKSYKIKFDDKQEFFSDYKEKDWVLLANFSDQTLIRNYLAYFLADSLDMDFAPSITFIDLYIDDVYQGNYLLTDQVEVTNDRVDIEENTSNIDTGYLLEYDWGNYMWGTENDNVFHIGDIPFVVKSPNMLDDHYISAQKNYIRDYMEEVFDVLIHQEDYTDLIDEASFIDWFIVNELFKNVDSGYSSVFLYKDAGGKLKMGPVWDFDLSTGNPGHLDESLRGPEGWYTSRHDKNQMFYYLMQYPTFRAHLRDRWNEVYIDHIIPILGEIYLVTDSITHSRYHNFLLWDVIGKNEEWYTAEEILALKTYDSQVWFLYDYLYDRMRWLNEEINKFN